MTEMTDEELIYNIRLGRREALELLFFRYEKKMRFLADKYHYIFRNIGYDNDDIRGLIHQSVYHAISGYRWSQGCFFNYLYSVLQGRFMDEFRNGSRSYEIKRNTLVIDAMDEYTLEDIVQDRGENIVSSYDISEYLAKIKELSETEEKTFFLYLQGYSYQEIAEILDVPEKKVSNLLQHARTKLKSRLQ